MSTPALKIVDTSFVRRTYQVRADQDQAIVAIQKQTGESWSCIVRELLDRGLAEKMADLAKRKATKKRSNRG
jgi:hypothetical protein